MHNIKRNFSVEIQDDEPMNHLEQSNKTILVAPLNWGLGHATRCIPIIQALLDHNYVPIIASDGNALELLRKEFPYIQMLALPSYHIEYSKTDKYFKWKMLISIPKIIKAVLAEKKLIQQWITKYEIDGIISDNRLGIYSAKIPSVYLTHQINVLSGNTTWFSTQCHRYFIKKHNECWVPDVAQDPNLTGNLGHVKNTSLNIKYIGPLSRMKQKELNKKYDLMVVLSGPEPQRSLLEEKLKNEVLKYKGKVIFIKGIVEKTQQNETFKNVTFYNFMNTKQLEQTFNESDLVLCRSGYTTVMDLVALQKKAFFIPTPGQYEQLYLAKKLENEGLLPFSLQEDFCIEDLSKINNFSGLPKIDFKTNWNDLFKVFEKM
ncbi:undecaprenyldiphospho-muramoylpentapeptide beta-N- acetylglucosaminyltransferase [Flavobacterium sp. TAB 87]|nr:undecaprenyldiphospho-muramoylpentapeptide beta-N- acetylglucosaminyltransferase [Flavobacterium sp. TAB 87]